MSTSDLPWHPGELRLQQQHGSLEVMAELGPRVVRQYMPEQHQRFFRALPLLLFAARANDGQLYASALFGEPGFIRTPDQQHLSISTDGAHPSDPAVIALQQGAPIGLLGIEFHSRRRNRFNGVVTEHIAGRLTVGCQQSFGNCPKYITRRQRLPNPAYGAFAQQAFHHPDADTLAFVQQADTLFIASGFDDGQRLYNRGLDLSHRGGVPGFIKVDEQNRLLFEDYPGNGFFCTLGNLLQNPQAGLLLMDFTRGHLLQLQVHTEIIATASAPRLLRCAITCGRWLLNASPWLWQPLPDTPPAGAPSS
ncbi:flavin-nucleotide-binding protein [Pseudomaricurvus sp. HS19]|uniref:flavin-nucleotide-binding protein n=1 Tax=Pseudomaricurvus sp. HS19 TaxID=2692626 RepID=UPI001369F49A|nr:flavin-nucleotide-binding protein [Pseudomaricurvus sp. HS19]MYM64441.1 flavin-nucleotide-binding protein [Pseudomaricurvus sp. HS19]